MKSDFVQHKYYVYIMASKPDGVLYIGVTDNIVRRVWEHKNNIIKNSFTARYNVHTLVYIEIYQYINVAIAREKQLKRWTRDKKKYLIESMNPDWIDIPVI